MTGDPLYRPLGMEPRAPWGSHRRRIVQIGATIVLLAGVGFAAAIMLQHRVADDRRVAVARIDVAPQERAAAATVAPPAVAAAKPEPAPQGTLSGSSVEMQNGVKIIRFNGGTSAASVTIPVESEDAIALAPAPDARVSEKTAEGVLPRIGPMGARPSSVYARHDPATKGPRIALVLTDLGTDQLATADAARRLPATVSFGFAPDVGDAAAQVAEARRLGHEAFLDLRPSDAPPAASIADPAATLRRRLGRWAGYVGVVLDPAAPPASAEEAGRRGLLSMAAEPGAALLVTRSIDVVADAAQGRPALEAAVARLVDLAKSKGTALGVIDHAGLAAADVASALDALAGQPVVLVPASAVLGARSGAVDASR